MCMAMAAKPAAELAFLSIAEAARLLRSKKISPVELLDASLAQIERYNPALNAFLTITTATARKRARLAEKEILRRSPKSPLHGIPLSLKDNLWTRGIRTTAGSRILENFVPRQDSDVAARLAQAGAVLLGKTNMQEFAYGITGDNPHYGPSRNPWNRERVSGGSSGGSAVAVAVGMGFASVGTDTGGSIRIPSSLCGIVGLKPTFGLVSVSGVVPLSPSLDHVGPLARSVSDICILLDAIAGEYPRGTQRASYRNLQKKTSRRFRLGLPKQYYFEKVDTEVRAVLEQAIKDFESLGARIEQVSMPHLAAAADAGTQIALAEATAFHQSAGYFPQRSAEYGVEARQRLESGEHVRAVDYLRALDTQKNIQADFDAAFAHLDAVIAPAAPIPAPLLGQSEVTIAVETQSVRAALVGMARPANVSGHPALSIPCGFTRDGLPVGLQLIGPRWGEARLLAIAHAFESATDWRRRPDLAW